MNELLLLAQDAGTTSVVNTLLQTDKIIPLTAIIGGLTLTTFWIVMHYFYSWIELCKNNEIKLRMIEAGHSASEIEQVIWAGKTVEDDDEEGKPKKARRTSMLVPPAKPIPQHVA
jgi:hypothetical protein